MVSLNPKNWLRRDEEQEEKDRKKHPFTIISGPEDEGDESNSNNRLRLPLIRDLDELLKFLDTSLTELNESNKTLADAIKRLEKVGNNLSVPENTTQRAIVRSVEKEIHDTMISNSKMMSRWIDVKEKIVKSQTRVV